MTAKSLKTVHLGKKAARAGTEARSSEKKDTGGMG